MAAPTQGTTISTETVPDSGTFDLPIGEVVSWNGPTANKAEIETTHLLSTAKEYIPGLADYGQFTMEMNWTDPEDAGQAALRQNFEASGNVTLNFQYSPGGGSRTGTFSGFVSDYPSSGSADAKVDQSCTIRVTGPVVES